EAADADLITLFPGPGFGEADGRHLRAAIGAAGDVALVDGMDVLEARDLLDADHAFMARLVGEPGRAGEVADRVDALDAREAPFVGHHMALLDLDARFLEAEVLHIAGDADRKNDAIHGHFRGLAALLLDDGGHVVLALLELL